MNIVNKPIFVSPFPVNKLAKMQSIKLIAPTGDTVEVNYQDLSLMIVNSQLCFYYPSSDGDLIMPLCKLENILSSLERG